MWSDFSTDSTMVGTLLLGDCETRLGQSYGEADGWSKFMLLSGESAYIESKYLSTEKPVLPDSETNNTSDNLDNWFPTSSDDTSTDNSVDPVEDEQNQDQAVSNPNPQGDKTQEEFLKDLAEQFGATYTPPGEGTDPDDNINHLEINTNHDYSGITISP